MLYQRQHFVHFNIGLNHVQSLFTTRFQVFIIIDFVVPRNQPCKFRSCVDFLLLLKQYTSGAIRFI